MDPARMTRRWRWRWINRYGLHPERDRRGFSQSATRGGYMDLMSGPLVAAGVAAFLIVLNAFTMGLGYVAGRLHERWQWHKRARP